MTAVAALVAFKAKAGFGEEVAGLIAKALPFAMAEDGTLTWAVLRSNAEPDTVFLVDIFADADGRDAHMAGEAARLIFATVPAHLAEEPDVHPCDLVASKS